MPLQNSNEVGVYYKVEATYNTAPGTGSAKQLKINPSPGLSLARTLVKPNAKRDDLLTDMPRLGSRMVPGSYNVDASVGGFDDILEAVMRSTWVAAVAITVDGTAPNASFTVDNSSQFTYVGTTTLHTKGLKRGDVFRFTNMSTAANNSINVRVKSIDAAGLVVTVHGTPLTTQAADSAATLTIMKKLKNPTTAVRRTFYLEQYYKTIDLSMAFGGCRFISMKIVGTPDGMATIEFGVLGASGSPLTAPNSPYYISPTLPTGIGLVFADATVSVNGVDIVGTAFELNYTIMAKTQPVYGATVSPDVFDSEAELTGSFSVIRADLANVTLFTAETEFAIHIGLYEPEAEPKDGMFINVPRCKLTAAALSGLGESGPGIEVLPFVCGASAGVTGTDDGLLTISSSAP